MTTNNISTSTEDTSMDFRKGQRRHTFLLIMIIVFGCLWASNPNPQEHRYAIEQDMADEQGYTSSTTVNVRIAETMLVDQNFLFFSITRYQRHGSSELATIGIFGHVFVLLDYDATVNTRMSFT